MSDVTILQADRFLMVDTPLGADKLKLTAFEGEESMSRLFSYRLQMFSEDEALDPKAILGKSVSFSVQRAQGRRHFNGVCSRFSRGPRAAHGMTAYFAEIVPSFWLLTRNADCKIFQEKKVTEIVEEVFGERGLTDYDVSGIRGTHPSRLYCVQYRETDFNFVSRLLEEEGIYYYFRHAEGAHTMVLADDTSGYEDCEESDVEFDFGDRDWECVYDWHHSFEFTSGKAAHKEYNYENSTAPLLSTATSTVSLSTNSRYELYDYPGRYTVKGDGDALIDVHMGEEEVRHEVTRGASRCRTFTPGGKFSLSGLEGADGTPYVITSIRHTGRDNTHIAGEGGIPEYDNRFTCIPASVKFRPERITPKSVVRGPQTAVTVGPSGQEIHTDQYGRVKVQFHWDRYGRNDDHSSCWVRVAQPWAGKRWGAQFMPRIGDEVVVAFLEGDPDEPLIVGSVYNDVNREIYQLPSNQTQSGIKTNSSQGGGSSNFNELKFEDKMGNELVYFQAEKDFDRYVKNDDELKVDNNQTITIVNNRTETVQRGDETVTVSQGNRLVEISTGNETLDVKTGNRSVKLGMGNDTLKISMGNQTTTVSLGKSETTAMQSVELKVGASSVKVDQMGVTIKGPMVKVEGTAMATLKSPMTTVQGNGMLTLTGGVIMIN